MANRESNYPTAQSDTQLNGLEFTGETIHSISELSKMGKPKNEAELEQRIEYFFEFCGSHNLRPGIETLSCALDCDRSTFWLWCGKKSGKSEEWREICQRARQQIIGFTEQSMLLGKLSPPVAIFSLKNIASWRDQISFEDVSRSVADDREKISVSELPLFDTDIDNFSEKWDSMKKKITNKEEWE